MKLSITSVKKRDGKIVPFSLQKITASIEHAGRDTGEFGNKESAGISKKVEAKLGGVKIDGEIITVQQIRDVVEPTIAEAGYFATAKYYILFGEKKQQKFAKKHAIVEPLLTETALEVSKKRYLRTDMDGKVIETPGEMLWRVARHMAKAEIQWGENGIVDETAKKFYERMVNFKFVCAGKAMFEAGNPGGTGQLSSCFVLPIEDSIQQIFKTLGDAAVVHKNNGGTGFNFSKIRPHGDKVKNVPKSSSGPVDFLRAFSAALSQILQGAKRQGANIAILNADHPDIIDFVTLKDQDGTVKNFNISVGASNKFMEAVQANKDWDLINPRNGEIWRTVKAREIFDLIAEHAWATGDPGLAFLDRLQEDNPTPSLGVLDATNPCGEVPLLPYESCNLNSIDLNRHLVKNKKGEWEIDWEDLEKSVKLGIRFLDNMIEVNTYALEEIRQMVKEGNRRIGLGVMGFAHMLYRMKIPYDSNEAVRVAERIAKFMRKKAEEANIELGKQRGPFPNFDISVYAGSTERYRNCALLMIAPTGTISLFANTSSGIEPVFSLVQVRRGFNEDSTKNAPTRKFTIADPVFGDYLSEKFDKETIENIMKQVLKDGNVDNVKELSKEDKKIFTTTHGIAPEWHVRIQAAWQKWIDNSVSKTINFPHNATVEDVKKAYMLGWKLGLKGITIYRDGSKMDQVLSVAGRESKLSKDAAVKIGKHGVSVEAIHVHTSKPASGAKEICPECASASLRFESGCVSCPDCGWSKCSI
ncbi:MAG: adenosylcobalamin-dependent ribonucleoside-diphosphate reductase [Patescibacteria group bacterium]